MDRFSSAVEAAEQQCENRGLEAILDDTTDEIVDWHQRVEDSRSAEVGCLSGAEDVWRETRSDA